MSLNESIVEDAALKRSGKPTDIRLFAGAGGCSLGFQQAGVMFALRARLEGVNAFFVSLGVP